MKRRQSPVSIIFDVGNYIFMIFIIIIMLYPLLNVISLSLSSSSAINRGAISWYPKGWNISGYKIILQDPMLVRAYVNTILYAAASTVLTLTFTSMVAYSLSIKEFIFKKQLTIFFTITMFFGGGMIPTYLIIKNLHLINTFTVMVLPGCVSAFNVIIFRTFFQGIPGELREAGIIDGANDLVILSKIIIPLSKPLLATFALFTIVGQWNSWFSALIYLTDSKRYPLQMILRRILNQNSGELLSGSAALIAQGQGTINPLNIQMASVIVVLFPILCLYPFLQKYFVKGMLVGSIKG